MSVLPEYRVTAAPASAESVFGLPLEHIRLDAGVETATVTLMLDAAVELGEAYTNLRFYIHHRSAHRRRSDRDVERRGFHRINCDLVLEHSGRR